MTPNFNKQYNQILEDLGVASVFGNDGAYDTSDARVPKILGPMLRRIPKSRKKRRKHKKSR